MNWKLIVVGGLLFWLVTFVVSFVTGMVIHGKVLEESYQATNDFWQPALRSIPPDMGAIMPRWILTGTVGSIVLAAIFGCIRGGLSGSGVTKGLKFGVVCTLFGWFYIASWSGVFYLPSDIWIWWAIEQPIYFLPGGAALGWIAEKLAPS